VTVKIPESHMRLLSREKPSFGMLGVVLADGTPHVTPIWFDYDGTTIIVNTARGRVKERVMRKKPVVALTIMDCESPYTYIQIRGHVVEEDEMDAVHQIRELARKYRGQYAFDIPEGDVRVTFKIMPESVVVRG
jgi:PPOX class probable F420-dependent enzyme